MDDQNDGTNIVGFVTLRGSSVGPALGLLPNGRYPRLSNIKKEKKKKKHCWSCFRHGVDLKYDDGVKNT